jgi:O-antigen ligase
MSARWDWAFTALISVVSIVLLIGTVVTIAGGLPEYSGAVVRLALLSASLIFLCLLFRRDAIRLDQSAVPSVAFAAVAIVSVVASPGFTSALLRLELYYAIVVVGCAVGFALRHCSGEIGKFILLSIAIVHAGFLVIAVQFAMAAPAGANPLAPPPYFMNVRHFAFQGFFGATAAVAVALADKRLRAAGILLAAAALFGIVMFGSRGALLAWTVFVVGVIALTPRRRAAVVLVLLVVSGAFALALVAETYDWMNTYSLLDRTTIPTGDTVSMLYVNDRTRLWLDSLLAIAQRPLLGFGPNGFIRSGCCNPLWVQPHNSILQLLLEFGFLGLVALTWAAVSLFGPRIRQIVYQTPRSGRDPLQVAALAILTAFAAFSLVDGLLYYPVPLVNFALVCAVFLGAPSSCRSSSI